MALGEHWDDVASWPGGCAAGRDQGADLPARRARAGRRRDADRRHPRRWPARPAPGPPRAGRRVPVRHRRGIRLGCRLGGPAGPRERVPDARRGRRGRPVGDKRRHRCPLRRRPRPGPSDKGGIQPVFSAARLSGGLVSAQIHSGKGSPERRHPGSYARLYRQVLAALGARIRFRRAADVILATFFVSHLTPFGSATGTLVNPSALEADGIAAATTGEAIALTSLTSTLVPCQITFARLARSCGRRAWPQVQPPRCGNVAVGTVSM